MDTELTNSIKEIMAIALSPAVIVVVAMIFNSRISDIREDVKQIRESIDNLRNKMESEHAELDKKVTQIQIELTSHKHS